MSEKYKFNNTEGIYFVTSTITQWVDLFTRDVYRELIADSLKHCINKKGLIIHAWCFMSNHIHLIISKKGDEELPEILRDFKKFTGLKLIDTIKTPNESRHDWMLKIFEEEASKIKRVKNFKLWQDGNHPVLLDSNKMLEDRLQYVHQNPVKAGWVVRSQDYRWSSATDYCGEKGILPVVLIQ